MSELQPDNFYYRYHDYDSSTILKKYAQAICEELLKKLSTEKIAVYETGHFSAAVINGYDYAISDLDSIMKELQLKND